MSKLPLLFCMLLAGCASLPNLTPADAVVMTNRACAHNPRIDVAGSAQSLSIRLHPDATRVISLLPVSCPAGGLYFGVTLALSQPVVQEAIDFEVVR
jgi:hypothetical protein